ARTAGAQAGRRTPRQGRGARGHRRRSPTQRGRTEAGARDRRLARQRAGRDDPSGHHGAGVHRSTHSPDMGRDSPARAGHGPGAERVVRRGDGRAAVHRPDGRAGRTYGGPGRSQPIGARARGAAGRGIGRRLVDAAQHRRGARRQLRLARPADRLRRRALPAHPHSL
ncbi:MAG: Phosphohistidine phosphatase SixA, partial [uncultured Nocardioidaceae bacterium]